MENQETTSMFLSINKDLVLRREAIRVINNAAEKGRNSSKAIRNWSEQLLELEDMGRPNRLRMQIGSLWRIDWQGVCDALREEKLNEI